MNKILSGNISGLGSKERMLAEDWQTQPIKLPQKPKYRIFSEEFSPTDTMVLVQEQIQDFCTPKHLENESLFCDLSHKSL